MNVKISVFIICVEAIIYLLLCNLHGFKGALSGLRQLLANEGPSRMMKIFLLRPIRMFEFLS